MYCLLASVEGSLRKVVWDQVPMRNTKAVPFILKSFGSTSAVIGNSCTHLRAPLKDFGWLVYLINQRQPFIPAFIIIIIIISIVLLQSGLQTIRRGIFVLSFSDVYMVSSISSFWYWNCSDCHSLSLSTFCWKGQLLALN